MGLDQFLSDGEAETRAALLAGTGCVGAKKRFCAVVEGFVQCSGQTFELHLLSGNSFLGYPE
jgi:hypothetical protein